MAIINILNTSLNKLSMAASDSITFSTDAVAFPSTTGNATAGGNTITGAVTSSFGYPSNPLSPNLLTIEGGGAGGTVRYLVATISTSSIFACAVPNVLTTVTGAVIKRFEQFQLQYKPAKIVLTNLTTGDTYTQKQGMAPRTVIKETAAGVRTVVTGNTMCVLGRILNIHGDILPLSSSFHIELTY